MSHSSRLAYLLGEMRRMMNGAVVGSMRFYGADYGLNYGVSIPTIRSVAQTIKAEVNDQEVNHKFACQLLLQEVRELRLAAFWFANPQNIVSLKGWDKAIINSEVAEEAAFALLYEVSAIEEWLSDDCDELLQYCALLSLAKRTDIEIEALWPKVLKLLETEPKLLPKGVVALIDTALKGDISTDLIGELINQMPADNHASNYIRDEVIWRLELRD